MCYQIYGKVTTFLPFSTILIGATYTPVCFGGRFLNCQVLVGPGSVLTLDLGELKIEEGKVKRVFPV